MARPNLSQHRKFRRLARTLGSDILARGVLELLWDACYESGDDYVGAAGDLEDLVGWQGAPGELTQALVDAGAPEGAGFIELAPAETADEVPRYRVHDLWHHAPEYVANRRSREAERRTPKTCARVSCGQTFFAADPRSEYCSGACRTGGWRDRRVTERRHNAVTSPVPTRTPTVRTGSKRDRRVTDDRRRSVTPDGGAIGGIVPGVTDRDGSLCNGDGRVTDRNGTPAPAPAPTPTPGTYDKSSAEMNSAPPSTPRQGSLETRPAASRPRGSDETRAAPTTSPFLTFPVVGSPMQTWTLSEAQVAEWASLFPNLDIRAECRKALAWIKANDRHRKTARGMAAFLARWLTRAVDSGRGALTRSGPTVISPQSEQNVASMPGAVQRIQERRTRAGG